MHIERHFIVDFGSNRSLNEIYAEFTNKGCWIHPRAEQLLEQLAAWHPVKESHLKLVAVSVRNLGFPKGGKYISITTSALNQGLELCPPQVGYALRLSYLDQTGSKPLYIAMCPIIHSLGNPFIFVVTTGSGGLLLYSEFAHAHSYLSADDHLVLVVP